MFRSLLRRADPGRGGARVRNRSHLSGPLWPFRLQPARPSRWSNCRARDKGGWFVHDNGKLSKHPELVSFFVAPTVCAMPAAESRANEPVNGMLLGDSMSYREVQGI